MTEFTEGEEVWVNGQVVENEGFGYLRIQFGEEAATVHKATNLVTKAAPALTEHDREIIEAAEAVRDELTTAGLVALGGPTVERLRLAVDAKHKAQAQKSRRQKIEEAVREGLDKYESDDQAQSHYSRMKYIADAVEAAGL